MLPAAVIGGDHSGRIAMIALCSASTTAATRATIRPPFAARGNSMAGSSLLALIDDIATVLDDVALLTKIASKKTAGVLGDDLALNAQQVAGVNADRELPVVWAVAKGSFRNKAILVPAALAISVVAPWLVTPLLMVGGAFLCFEGAEKILHQLLHPKHISDVSEELAAEEAIAALAGADLAALEKDKIRGAVRTDFILSAEIIAITLGTVSDSDIVTRILVLTGIAIIMTVGVYGLVAGIVKLDDAGLYLLQRQGNSSSARSQRALGRAILVAAPGLMKFLSVAGTAAMFLVGGGILVHGIPGGEAQIARLEAFVRTGSAAVSWLAGAVPTLASGAIGLVAGLAVVAAVNGIARLRGKKA